jgi:hypothetical protein
MQQWFGVPWWSYICYTEDGRLMTETRVERPLGEPCLGCKEPVSETDDGILIPYYDGTNAGLVPLHKECNLRSVVGGIKHVMGECRYVGDCNENRPAGMTLREEANAVWDWVGRHGIEGSIH